MSETYNAAARLIESTQLTPTEHSIWRAFLDEAVDCEYAARFIWQGIHDQSDRPPEPSLARAETRLEADGHLVSV